MKGYERMGSSHRNTKGEAGNGRKKTTTVRKTYREAGVLEIAKEDGKRAEKARRPGVGRKVGRRR